MRDKRGENTRAAHLPQPPDVEQSSLGVPVWRTAAFAFSSAEEFADVIGDRQPGYSYSRVDNPTVDAFADAIAALEGANVDGQVVGQAFTSGMAAITATLMSFTESGAHVVAPAAVYGGTYGLLAHVLARFGVSADFVDTADPAAVAQAVRPNTRLIWTEALANPTMEVPDLPALAGIARDADALLVVDATFATPVVCRPLEHGADLVVHSATKYIGGHSDVTGGVVVGRPELLAPVRHLRIETGGALAPDEAFLLRRGLETLPVRVRRQCASALVFAAAIAKHPAVKRVDYPGLEGHRGHELARRLFDAGPEGTRFGAVVTVTPHGGYDAGLAFANGLRLAQVASSLGGTHTKVSHVASTSHRQFDEAALDAAAIDPGALRFSIGLEDAEDLIVDATHALDALQQGQAPQSHQAPGGAGPAPYLPPEPSYGQAHEPGNEPAPRQPDEYVRPPERDGAPAPRHGDAGSLPGPQPGAEHLPGAAGERAASVDQPFAGGEEPHHPDGAPLAAYEPPPAPAREAFREAGAVYEPVPEGADRLPFTESTSAPSQEQPAFQDAPPPAGSSPAPAPAPNPWPRRSDNPDSDKSEWWMA